MKRLFLSIALLAGLTACKNSDTVTGPGPNPTPVPTSAPAATSTPVPTQPVATATAQPTATRTPTPSCVEGSHYGIGTGSGPVCFQCIGGVMVQLPACPEPSPTPTLGPCLPGPSPLPPCQP